MKLKGKDLEFISQIKRDGSGTVPLKEGYADFMAEDTFKVRCLSITCKTYIAMEFNSFVVRLKNETKVN